MRVAFDIDDTLWKCRGEPFYDQIPDYDLIHIVKWFSDNGHEVFFWSAGGTDYCETIITKLGLNSYGTVIKKGKSGETDMDIAFDDKDTNLAKVDVRVKREPIKGFLK